MSTPGALTEVTDIAALKADNVINTTNSLFQKDFPADFIFGCGSSAFQVEGAPNEGGRGKSIWDTFCNKRALETNDDGWLSFKKGGHFHQFESDVRLMKQLGVKAYRFTISWPRIFPSGTPGNGNLGVNKEGVAFYNNLINALLARDIVPFAVLFHWEVPQALEDKYGGFLSDKIREDFKNFAEFCFKEFGDRVKNWTTVNEPYVFSWGGYALGFLAPGRGYPQTKTITDEKGNKTTSLAHSNAIGTRFLTQISKKVEEDNRLRYTQEEPSEIVVPAVGPATEPYLVGHNLILAHADVANLYNTIYKPLQRGRIGITLNCDWHEAQDNSSQNDIEAAHRKLEYTLGWFMSALFTGVYPKSMTDFLKERLPKFSEKDIKLLTKPTTRVDFVGINYYTAYTVKDAPQLENPNEPPHFTTDPRVKVFPLGEKSTSAWIYIYGKGLQELLSHINNEYGNKFEIYVTENGIDNIGDDPSIDQLADHMRIKYLQDHIYYIHEAIHRDNVNVKGYFPWSIFDSFEWGSANLRFGNYYVDYEDKAFKRYPKYSAAWYKFFLQNGLYPNNYQPITDQLKETGVTINEHNENGVVHVKRKLNSSSEAQANSVVKKPNYGLLQSSNQ